MSVHNHQPSTSRFINLQISDNTTSQMNRRNEQEAKEKRGEKRGKFEAVDLTHNRDRVSSPHSKKSSAEMRVSFVHGSSDHIETYVQVIDEAEAHVIIASWNLNFIPQEIFSSLMRAKNRGVSISFVVQSVKRQETLNYFYADEESSDDYSFTLSTTKSHAKFIFVDNQTLVLGSYNALGDNYEESLDASVFLKGTINQLWPFYMSIYETYTSIGENVGGVFDGLAMISKARHPGPRPLLQRFFEDTSKIYLLRTIQEHEDFIRLATPYNGDVSIYSPFSTKDNTFKRLQALSRLVPTTAKVTLKVLPKFQSGLTRLLTEIPDFRNRVSIETVSSHQKVVILGTETICVGSLNWLSAAQDANASYSNIELSVVLQGPKAAKIIKDIYTSNGELATLTRDNL